MSAFAAAVIGASIGTILGNRFLERVAVHGIQLVVGVGLVILAAGLAAGLL